MSGAAQLWLERIVGLPGFLQLRKIRFDRAFDAGRAVGCCRGLFATYGDAAVAAPKSRPLGYNHADAANMYRDRLSRVYPSDYPMMLWLQKAFAAGARDIFDLGGHIGLKYYAYRRLVEFPDDLSWRVYDVPAVLAKGRQEALKLDHARRLTFTDRGETAAEADVLFTAGCLQYLEETLAQRVASLRQRPRWLLVNVVPLHERFSFWTVQCIGTAFCPYRIQRMQTFFSELEQLGYRVLDIWENPDTECWIAFEPKYSLDHYSGAALRLD